MIILGFGILIAVGSAVLFGILQWTGIGAGSFLDWMIGLGIAEWLLIITTVPWDLHFTARGVVDAAERSQQEGITVRPEDTIYAQTIAQRFFWLACVLHILTAAGLYALAVTGITSLGYLGAVGALLLTFWRPILRGYGYLISRLNTLQKEVSYPREDVQELRNRVQTLERQSEEFSRQLSQFDTTKEDLLQELAQLQALQRQAVAENLQAHERLSREAHTAVAQLSTDGQVLDHVREIVRFFKSA